MLRIVVCVCFAAALARPEHDHARQEHDRARQRHDHRHDRRHELLGKNLNSSQTPTSRISWVAASCVAARLAARTHLCKLKGAETRKLETKLL